MTNLIKNQKTCFFALGFAAATAGVKFLKSKMFHDNCVKAVAQGMKLREDATASIAKIKEDAEDIRFEAQQQHKPLPWKHPRWKPLQEYYQMHCLHRHSWCKD